MMATYSPGVTLTAGQISRVLFAVSGLIAWSSAVEGQETAGERPLGPPGFSMFRADEDYTYLRDGSPYRRDPFDPLKFIRLNADGSVFLTLGGEVRPRFAFFDNPNWERGREESYAQRLSLHISVNLGRSVRLFGEVYHGLLSKDEPAFAEDDALALHQGFLELRFPVGDAKRVSVRIGRQELAYGSARLVGIREGPNIRRSFDAVRTIYTGSQLQLEGFVGSEVVTSPGVFDNSRNRDLVFWGVFSRVTVPSIIGSTEAYYFGFDVEQARYDLGSAPERRHTLGVRRFGVLGSAFRYNTELMFQFGNFGGEGIRAFAIETDYAYSFHAARFRPVLGIKLDYASGDHGQSPGTLNTFNPMFENPAYFGLLAQVTPMNLIDVHPSVALELAEGAELVLDWDFFWRANLEDGLYSPPRFLVRPGDPTQRRYVGHQPGFEFAVGVNRHVTWSAEASYFVSGGYIEDSGDAENILHLATTLSFKF